MTTPFGRSSYYVIGCGGVGSWAVPALARLVRGSRIVLVDGDKLEEKNLDRQLFTDDDLLRNKAEALAERHELDFLPSWFTPGLVDFDRRDWLLVAVDNHAARHSALLECDRCGCRALFASNETHSAEAFVYLPEWRGGPYDPRRYYPEIETDNANDPRRVGVCTGQAQEENRQLVTANFMAAALMMHLLVVWGFEARKLDRDTLQFLPFHLRSNLTKLETLRLCDRASQTSNEEKKG